MSVSDLAPTSFLCKVGTLSDTYSFPFHDLWFFLFLVESHLQILILVTKIFNVTCTCNFLFSIFYKTNGVGGCLQSLSCCLQMLTVHTSCQQCLYCIICAFSFKEKASPDFNFYIRLSQILIKYCHFNAIFLYSMADRVNWGRPCCSLRKRFGTLVGNKQHSIIKIQVPIHLKCI